MNLENKKIIIFDMDGTLMDSIGIWNKTDQELIRRFSGVTVSEETAQNTRDYFLLHNTSKDTYVEYCNFLKNKYGMKESKEFLLEARGKISNELLEQVELKEYAPEVVKKFKELGYIVVLASLTTRKQLDIYCYKNQKIMNNLQLNENFDLIIGTEEVKNKKPKPDVYLYALKYFNVVPEDCIVFEDSLHGIMAAKGANIETINVYDRYSDADRDEIDKLTTYKITSYKEVLDYLETMDKSKSSKLEMKKSSN